VRKAILRGALTGEGFCAAESFHLLREALASHLPVAAVLAAESARGAVERALHDSPEREVALVPDQLFQSISGTETSQGVVALVELPRWSIDRLFSERSLLVVLDGVQDPGNAGAAVRAAEAFGASGVIFVKGSASPFNAKTLRASAGSLFRVPFLAAFDPVVTRASLDRNRLAVYAAMPGRSGAPSLLLTHADFRLPCAFIIGNEGRGVSDDFRSQASAVTIPTAGVESLNAALAAAILLYEAHRQRSAL
jgi:TrmH family RNA methyltransferase